MLPIKAADWKGQKNLSASEVISVPNERDKTVSFSTANSGKRELLWENIPGRQKAAQKQEMPCKNRSTCQVCFNVGR